MFADDIYWFKPIELKTKTGRRGNIKEALGMSFKKSFHVFKAGSLFGITKFNLVATMLQMLAVT